MSDQIAITATEAGVVRLFAVDLDPADLEAFHRRNGRWPLQEALGADLLDPGHVDLIRIGDLEGVGLRGYLEQGMGVSRAELDSAGAVLDGLSGAVLVVGSRAFGGQAQHLTVRAPLRYLASLHEETPPVRFDPLPEGPPAAPKRRPPSAAAMSGRVAMVALFLMFALTALMIWIAR